jgi:hypothetical protein
LKIAARVVETTSRIRLAFAVDALLFVFEARLEMNAIDPDVDVALRRQIAPLPRGLFVKVLSDRHYVLREVTFEYHRGDGEWQTLRREVFDRGHAAALLPYNPVSRMVVLVRQFRLPAYVAAYDDLMVAAGMLDNETPEKRIRAEAEEETGYRLHDVRKAFEAFMSPGAVTENFISSSPNMNYRCESARAVVSRMRARILRCWNFRSMRRSR